MTLFAFLKVKCTISELLASPNGIVKNNFSKCSRNLACFVLFSLFFTVAQLQKCYINVFTCKRVQMRHLFLLVTVRIICLNSDVWFSQFLIMCSLTISIKKVVNVLQKRYSVLTFKLSFSLSSIAMLQFIPARTKNNIQTFLTNL